MPRRSRTPLESPPGSTLGASIAIPDDTHDATHGRDAGDDLLDGFAPGQVRVRGLYSGGSLAGEAKLVLRAVLGSETAKAHEIIDLGDDEYTVGRPHPMIDPRLRNETIEATATDPTVAVILLDVVLGTGAHPDPAGALVPAITAAQATAAKAGRRIAVVASVCGTEGDPQGLGSQEATLTAAGVTLASSNARAARIAAVIVSRRAGAVVGGAP